MRTCILLEICCCLLIWVVVFSASLSLVFSTYIIESFAHDAPHFVHCTLAGCRWNAPLFKGLCLRLDGIREEVEQVRGGSGFLDSVQVNGLLNSFCYKASSIPEDFSLLRAIVRDDCGKKKRPRNCIVLRYSQIGTRRRVLLRWIILKLNGMRCGEWWSKDVILLYSFIFKFSVFCLGWKVAEKALQFRLPIVKWVVVARAGGRWSEDDEEFTV